MRRILCALIITILLLVSVGSLGVSSTLQFNTSFDSDSIEVTEDKVSESFLIIKDTEIKTRYLNTSEPIVLDIKVTNTETSQTIERSYTYDVDNTGQTKIQEDISLHEFDSSDFPTDKPDLEIELIADHPSLNARRTTNTVSILTGVNYQSCLDVLNNNPDSDSGFYDIKPDGFSSSFEVYCDMDTRGGGWTAVWRNAAGPLDSTGVTNDELWSSSTSTVTAPFEASGDFSAEKNINTWDYSTTQDGGEWLKTIRDYDSNNNQISVDAGSSDGYDLGSPTDVVLDLGSGVSFNDFIGSDEVACRQLDSPVSMTRYYNGNQYNHGSTDYVGGLYRSDGITIGFANRYGSEDDCGTTSDNVMDSWAARHVISYNHPASTDYNIVRCQFTCWSGDENRIKETTWYYRASEPDV